MRYSTISLSGAVLFSAELTASEQNQSEDYVMGFLAQNVVEASSPGTGVERLLKLDDLEALSVSVNTQVKALISTPKKNADKDKLEGEICGLVYRALEHVPIEILDDPGFWRFIGIRYFWGFTLWRESSALAKNNIATYFSAKSSSESIPLRLYLRAQAMRDSDGQFPLAEAVSEGTDFWRSHIIRVRTGRARALAQAFAKLQGSDRMMTDELRQFARRLNRQWANVIMLDYDDKQSNDILKEIKKSLK
jgi:hypothetical protein